MAKQDFIATYSDSHVTLTIKRKTAARIAIALENASDWIGNMEAEDAGMTSSQLMAVENDVVHLVNLLANQEVTT